MNQDRLDHHERNKATILSRNLHWNYGIFSSGFYPFSPASLWNWVRKSPTNLEKVKLHKIISRLWLQWSLRPLQIRSEELRNEGCPFFFSFRPGFSECSPNFRGFFVLCFLGNRDHRKFTQKKTFFSARLPANFEEKIHKSFLESAEYGEGLYRAARDSWNVSFHNLLDCSLGFAR